MAPLSIVNLPVRINASLGVFECFIVTDIDVFLFERAPKTFGKDVIKASSFARHANADSVVEEHLGKVDTSKLDALVGIEEDGRGLF